MTAEEMFGKLEWKKIIKNEEIKYKKQSSDGINYNFICFDIINKETYIYSSCEEEDDGTVLCINKELLNAIQKQIEELGWDK